MQEVADSVLASDIFFSVLRNIDITFGMKIGMVWLPEGERMTRLAVSTQYRRVTERKTNAQTDRHLATA